jgi:Na+-transporting NADH:ubiquinone oxidoreductase subunit NqrB
MLRYIGMMIRTEWLLNIGSAFKDPRLGQVITLSVLYVYALHSGFTTISLWFSLAVIAAVLLLQFGCDYMTCRSWNYKSALISALSLVLLLRTSELWVWGLAVVFVVVPKFLLRINGKHCFNPTNFAIAVLLLLNLAWVSPGRWGNEPWLILLVVAMGIYVLARVRLFQCSVGFFCSYAGLIFIRGWYLGEPLPLIWHQFTHISLLIFTLLMISDPRTTPSQSQHRWLFGLWVGAVSFYLQFWHFEPNALFYALFASYPWVWLADRFSKEGQFQWKPSLYQTVPMMADSSASLHHDKGNC